jgi:D-alanyl-D-alanine carboxypeptidase
MQITTTLQHLVDRTVEEHPEIPGVILSVEAPGISWTGASGLSHIDLQTPMQPNSQFRSASIGKMVCAAALLMLVDDGHVELDKPAAHYLSASMIEGLHVYEGHDYSDQITVRQLLNHTSGLWDFLDDHPPVGEREAFLDLMQAEPDKLWNPAEILEWVKQNSRPLFPPGSAWRYTDTGFLVAGLLIEHITGQPLHVVYRERLFDRLGMAHTYMTFREPERRSIPDQRESDSFVGELNYSLPQTISADWAGGGLTTTASDLQRFIRAAAEGRLFKNETTQEAMLSWTPTGEPGVYYGLGVRCFFPAEFGQRVFSKVWGHSGALKSFMFYSPSLNATITGTLNQAATEGVWSSVRPVAPLLPQVLLALAEG